MVLRCSVLAAVLLIASATSYAEQVTLTNGDRLTGTVVKSDDKVLTLKTEFAGTVEIEWSGIKEFVSDQQLVVTSSTRPEPLEGTVKAKEGEVTVTTPAGQSEAVPQTSIVSLRPPTGHPPLTRGWTGGINLGFALTGGNSETTNLAIAFNASRPTDTDKLTLYANSIYATNYAVGADPSTTANNVRGGIRYDRNISQRLFAFVNADFQTDALQLLDLRSIFGGGLGFHAIKGERTTLDLLGGANYTRENYTTFTRNFAALTFGDEFTHKFANTSLFQRFFIFPDMNNFGEYRTTFDIGTVTKLSKWLGWQNSFSDVYVTNPPPGTKKNDVIFTSGLNVTFNH